MRSPRTLSRYVAKEVLTYTSLGLIAITIVMVTQNLFRFLDEMISAGAHLSDVLAIIASLVMMLATYTFPIAFLFGVLLAFGRLASDTEVRAMHCCGVGLGTVMLPLTALGLCASLLTGYLVLDAEHEAQLTLRRIVKTMAARGGFVEPGRFRKLGERMLFVRNVDATDQLEGVVISDRTDAERPLIIFAESGRMNWDETEHQLEFRLVNGDIHLEPDGFAPDPDRAYRRIAFREFEYAFDGESIFGRRFSSLRPREMTLPQLRGVIQRARAGDPLDDLRRKDPMQYELQLHRRFALPVAPFLFAFVGAPLGLEPRRGARSWGVMVCVAVVFVYYAFMTFGEFLAMQRVLSAVAALWLPNALFAAAAVILLARARRVQG
jgi:lipopolysaccharide export system permease protein